MQANESVMLAPNTADQVENVKVKMTSLNVIMTYRGGKNMFKGKSSRTYMGFTLLWLQEAVSYNSPVFLQSMLQLQYFKEKNSEFNIVQGATASNNVEQSFQTRVTGI